MSFKPITWLAVVLWLSAGMAAAAPAELEAARAWYWQHPYQPEAINRLALQLLKMGDADSAVVLLERALRIAPDRQDIRANLLRLKSGSRQVADSPWQAQSAVAGAEPNAAAPASPPSGPGKLPEPWPQPPAHP
ncbi:tetratricopeptide repeat protein [Chromobacterium piscinae]|uniref:tetratricopeptide repeat protein n=1 Tax=Chromobacterium piscinae TaxID=686831 RepID=UPI001E542F27|nr:tetratricopeptide repeat protein [Chromobacterium piscinae]